MCLVIILDQNIAIEYEKTFRDHSSGFVVEWEFLCSNFLS
jgi:hypothetical protein